MNRATDWLKQAERDLGAAGNAASAGYHEWVAFGAQQSAGKSAKALVQALQGEVRGAMPSREFSAFFPLR